jgi:regulator of replication initiation timing
MEEDIVEIKKLINDLITEVNALKIKNARLEAAQKILRTEALRIKTMSDKYLPTIGDMMGHNGRKGA